MKVTLSLMANDSVSQDPVKIPHQTIDGLIPGFPGRRMLLHSNAERFQPPFAQLLLCEKHSSGTV